MPLSLEFQQILILFEIYEHQEEQNEMSEVKVFLRCSEIFVILLGFVAWLPSGIANKMFLQTTCLKEN